MDSRLADVLLCLPGHQVKRNWEGWECGEAWGLQAGARSPFCSLVDHIHLGQIDTVKGSLDWIFFQMLPKRAGRPLSEEMAGTRGGGIDAESPPVALWGGWGDPEGVLGRSQEHLAVLIYSFICIRSWLTHAGSFLGACGSLSSCGAQALECTVLVAAARGPSSCGLQA